ncbi:hypothetical protein [Actinomadura gamaensis]|uniref:Uncharacterized protein n=1 Tax=Actinomadura gamaensis TaxID=1763541 RepID=A0ABV9UA61_9ACTN
MPIEIRLVGGVGVDDGLGEVADLVEHGSDLIAGQRTRARDAAEIALVTGALLLGLVDPLGHHSRVRSRLEGGLESAEILDTLVDLFADRRDGHLFVVGFLCRQRLDRRLDAGGCEDGRQPGVDRRQDFGFTQVHRLGVLHVVDLRVLRRRLAPVVRLGVVPGPFHLQPAVATVEASSEYVVPRRLARLAGLVPSSA